VLTGVLNLRQLAIRGMRLTALLCMVIVCSAAGQDTITGDPPPCLTSDVALAGADSAGSSADDSLDTEEAEAPPVVWARRSAPHRFSSTDARLTRPIFRRDIPPELAR
jgi:hypothetical protein